MATTVIKSIGSAPGRDYPTIAAWDAATAGNLVAADEIRISELYNDSVFSEGYQPSSSTTNATHYRMLRAAPGQAHTGLRDTGVRIIRPNSLGPTFNIVEEYFRIERLALSGPAGQSIVLRINSFNKGVRVEGVLIYDAAQGGCETVSDNDLIINTIVIGAGTIGFRLSSDASGHFNCTAINCATGFAMSSGLSGLVKNCIAAHNPGVYTGFSGSFAGLNNLTTDGTAPGDNSKINQTIESIKFGNVNLGEEDPRISSGSTAQDAGVALTATFTTDFLGTTRPIGAAWDIGAHEAESSEVIKFHHSYEMPDEEDEITGPSARGSLAQQRRLTGVADATLSTTPVVLESVQNIKADLVGQVAVANTDADTYFVIRPGAPRSSYLYGVLFPSLRVLTSNAADDVVVTWRNI